jgi:hypothetical protein
MNITPVWETYYPTETFDRVICLSDLGNILEYYLDKTTLLKDEVLLTVGVICQNITVPNITTETYTKYNNAVYIEFMSVTI